MVKIFKISEFSRKINSKKSYFERIRTVRMVRMVRSLADRTFQLRHRTPLMAPADLGNQAEVVVVVVVVRAEGELGKPVTLGKRCLSATHDSFV